MTDFQTFKKEVQTFGSRTFLSFAPEAVCSATGPYALVLDEERALDDRLDTFEPPFDPTLPARLMKAIVTDQNKRLFFIFLRHSTWLSLLFMLCGFYFGYLEARQSYADAASYFSDMFI